jgi:hypothetical protein
MPGVGVRTAARILLEVGDGSSFPTSGHLAAYAGLAPVTRRSGTSIRGEHNPRAVTSSSNAPSSCPRSRPCPTRSAGPTTTARGPRARNTTPPLICLARHRVNVLHAMLRTATPYQVKPVEKLALAA